MNDFSLISVSCRSEDPGHGIVVEVQVLSEVTSVERKTIAGTIAGVGNLPEEHLVVTDNVLVDDLAFQLGKRVGNHWQTVEVEEKSLEDPENLAEVKALGFTQAPVVITATYSWSGARPDKLETLA